MSTFGTPLVSVVVPVHNVEPYLSDCLDSILAQTESRIEVICVDDASTDRSAEILRRYAAADPRVVLLSHPFNRGLSAARNTGLAAARSPWVVFVDSDDVVSTELCAVSLAAAAEHGADAVFFDIIPFDDGHPLPELPPPGAVRPAGRAELLARKSYAYTMLLKVDLLRRQGILFPLGLCMQDVPVHWRIVLECARPVLLNRTLVWYRQRPTSISYATTWKRADGFIVYDMTRDYLHATGQWEDHHRTFLVAEMNYFADIYSSMTRGGAELAARAHAAIMGRMTPLHWEVALDDKALPGKKRDFILSSCRPESIARSWRQLAPCLRHWSRRLGRGLFKWSRGWPQRLRLR